MEQKELSYKERTINLFGDIDEDTVNDTIERIVKLNISDEEYITDIIRNIRSVGFSISPDLIEVPPIIINLNTPGGYCYDGLALCDSIRTSDTPVKIICYGKVMSMGIPILLSAKYKAAHKNTTFMIHGLSSGAFGKAEQIRENVEEINRLESLVTQYILEHSKFPKKKMKEIIEKKLDYYFTAEEALQYKIIDEIIN